MNDLIELSGVGIMVFLMFLGMSSPVIIVCLIYYLKKRLEHKQILAAIEKGTTLSELRPAKRTGPLWIKNLTAGIALLIIAAGFVCVRLVQGYEYVESFGSFFIAVILFGVGIAWLIRGLLQRKVEKQSQTQPANKNNTAENKKPNQN